MHTEHRAEGAELEPAREKLLIHRITGRGIARFPAAEEASRVSVQYGMPDREKFNPAGIWFLSTCQVPVISPDQVMALLRCCPA